jgi:hypothetical protein
MSTPAERNLALNGLTAKMQREFASIWMRLNLNNPDVLRDPLAAVLAEVANKYGDAAVALAADFYDEMRADVVKTGPRFTPKLAAVPDLPRFESLAGWGIGPLFGADPDPALALSNLAGGLQETVTDAYMGTIAESSLADPAAQGWQRVANLGACTFCRMLEGRGSVYSETGVLFSAHGHCGCSAEPAFEGESRPVKPYKVSPSRTIDPATGKPVIDADYRRARAWIKANL